MPRDGSNIYHRPPGTDGVPNYTVESARYNAFTADIEQDLNLPRPVIAGGTGANNAADAMNNLGGELAKQLIVNYNSDPFQAGSFYSAAGATGAPSVNAFTGICYSAVIAGVATTDLFIEARDQVTGNLWVRQKQANVWGLWSQAAGVTTGATVPVGVTANSLWWDPTRGKLFIYYDDGNSKQWVEAVAVPNVDPNLYVQKAGDTMTGPLVLAADPAAPLQSATKQYVDAAAASRGGYGLAVTAAAGTLTVNVTNAAGATPTPAAPATFVFRNATYNNGVPVVLQVTAAASFVISSGTTLGASTFPRLYLSAHNDAGTFRLGGFIATGAFGIWCPQEHLKYVTTAPDNTAQVLHTNVAIGVAAPWCLIGECDWLTTQTPGAWTAPDVVTAWSEGMKKPGDLVQSIHQPVTASNLSGSTIMNYPAIPTNTLGTQFMSQAITPVSAANRLVVDVKGLFVHSTANGWSSMALFQDSTVNALTADVLLQTIATGSFSNFLHYEALAGLAVSTTFNVRAGAHNAGTHYLNNDSGQPIFNGVANSYIRIQELKG